jgi:hypothetical protein
MAIDQGACICKQVAHLNDGGELCGNCFANDENVTLPCGKKACDECVRRWTKDEVPS